MQWPRARGKAPRTLVGLSLLLAVAAAGAAGVGVWHGGAANIVAAVLWLASGMLSYRARTISRRCPIDPTQRGKLRERLCGLDPLEVRVSAVNEPDSIRYARELRNVIQEAAWPTTGVFKRNGGEERTGVALAVRNIVAPPGEAIILVNTLRRIGTQVTWAHKPTLSHDRTIEIQVGRLG
jgi:hypothetical protein